MGKLIQNNYIKASLSKADISYIGMTQPILFQHNNEHYNYTVELEINRNFTRRVKICERFGLAQHRLQHLIVRIQWMDLHVWEYYAYNITLHTESQC